MSSSDENDMNSASGPDPVVASLAEGKEKDKRVWNRGKLYPPGL